MPAPLNAFKQALRQRTTQYGLWVALAEGYTAEVVAGAGFDWLLLDAEHAPNDIRSLVRQLQAIKASPSHAIVRPPVGDSVVIKQLLDIGVQTLLVPMVESGAQAAALVRATRYPPAGIRGIGSALARASDFGRIADYLPTADEQICLLPQVESPAGLENVDDIASTEGVDGVFIGPSDLAATMGHLGNPGHPQVRAAIEKGIERILANGKAAGILAVDETQARHWLDQGVSFVAVGTDVSLLSRGALALAEKFKGG